MSKTESKWTETKAALLKVLQTQRGLRMSGETHIDMCCRLILNANLDSVGLLKLLDPYMIERDTLIHKVKK